MKKSNTIKKLLSYLKNYKLTVIAVVLFAILSTTFVVLAPVVTGNITTKLYEGVKTGNFDIYGIIILIAVLLILYVISQLFVLLQNFSMTKLSVKIIQKIRNDIDCKMHKMKLNYYDTHTNGEILSTITNDVETLNNAIGQELGQVIAQVFKAIGILIMMLSINVWLTIIAVATVPLTLLAAKGVLIASSKKYEEQQNLLGKLNGIIEENYNGQMVIQAFNYQNHAINDFDKVNNELQKCAQSAETSAGLVTPITTLVNNAGYILSAIVGCVAVVSGRMKLGNVQAMLQYTKEFSEPFVTIAGVIGTFSAAIAAAGRIFTLLDEEEEIPNPKKPIKPTSNKGTVEFKNVAFGYVPNNLLMTNVNIKVEPGQKVAVVGPTGAGKTTLINLLMRFYEINSGSILVDGVDIKKMTREELRSRFGMVLQDTWLFEGNIMENLAYGGSNISEERIIDASKTACTDNFIKNLPDGYNMILSKGAENISQGQRQMLTIARAMATDPEIMILDEATSNVDTHTEVMIQKAMKKLMEGRTSFVIAHRLSTIKDSDIILYMENGDIKEAGNHDQLMALHGKYETLYNSQFE